MKVRSFASGSSGNALLVESGGIRLLVDAGLPPALLFRRLRDAGLQRGSLSAILLTHEHIDHAQGAAVLAQEWQVPIISAPETLRKVLPTPEEGGSRWAEPLEVGKSLRVGTLEVTSFPVSHDAIAPCGYMIHSGAWRICVAVDTGDVPGAMLEMLRAAHLLVVEANHDRERLLNGPYPWHLKQRILSPTGHLSNEQTIRALEAIVDNTPRWVWLAHLSKTNNTPDLARRQIIERLTRSGANFIQADILPPGAGPVWDSTSLWADAAR
ncbi:MAG TPA: MBL fold metallo-hydrolase [Ktedonobacterales bacterium]|jgi:phosphoribosyl 1,2-cyclic phosphodiesterase